MSKTKKAVIIVLATAGLAATGGALAASGGSADIPVAAAPNSYYHT